MKQRPFPPLVSSDLAGSLLAWFMQPPRPEVVMLFKDRTDAGRVLAEILVPLVPSPCVVAAIPRGGVVVALPIADRLRAPLRIAYARKLSVPFAGDVAFGAVDEDGRVRLNYNILSGMRLAPDDVEAAKTRAKKEIEGRIALYGIAPLAPDLPGAAVVLVDDGLATGLTMHAAIDYARRNRANWIAVATPCASAAAAERCRSEVDLFVSRIVDENFTAVGRYYSDFRALSDEEVVAWPALERAPRCGPPHRPSR